jgi:hypothetical protein
MFGLLASGLRLSGQIVAIKTYPFIKTILGLKVSHLLMTKDATDFLTNNQVFSWVKKYEFGYILKYSSILFKVFQKKHPAILFKDFAFTLAGEGCKRLFYLYLHYKITAETNILFHNPKITNRLN